MIDTLMEIAQCVHDAVCPCGDNSHILSQEIHDWMQNGDTSALTLADAPDIARQWREYTDPDFGRDWEKYPEFPLGEFGNEETRRSRSALPSREDEYDRWLENL